MGNFLAYLAMSFFMNGLFNNPILGMIAAFVATFVLMIAYAVIEVLHNNTRR